MSAARRSTATDCRSLGLADDKTDPLVNASGGLYQARRQAAVHSMDRATDVEIYGVDVIKLNMHIRCLIEFDRSFFNRGIGARKRWWRRDAASDPSAING